MQVKYSYLDQQFADVDAYFQDLRKLVATGEFTLGPFVEAFEKKFAAYIGVKHAIGTNTGTGALILSLKAVGVRPGSEVITVANTFIATVGAIVAAGARPVFVDCDERYQIDVTKIEAAITQNGRDTPGALGRLSAGNGQDSRNRRSPRHSRCGGRLPGRWGEDKRAELRALSAKGKRLQHAPPETAQRLGRWRDHRYERRQDGRVPEAVSQSRTSGPDHVEIWGLMTGCSRSRRLSAAGYWIR